MIIDILTITLVVAFFIQGYMKGVIVAIFSVVAFILGIICALKLSELLASFLLFFATVQTYFLIYRLLGAFLLDLSFFDDWQELINSLISIALFLLLYSRIQLFIAATLVFPYIDDASLQERPGTTKKPNDQLLDQI